MISFEQIGLSQPILQAIAELGFELPTPIQQQTIPHLLEKENDLIALAQTGTGKTAAFGLPILEQINLESKQIQAMILCPTRELCLQIATDLADYSKYQKGIKVCSVYGGTDIKKQISELRKKPAIVVGTPGRVVDLIMRDDLKINGIRWMILDEADEMLSMGFKDDLDTILAETPSNKQTLLFSATMPSEMKDIANNYMQNSEKISVTTKEQKSNENISHEYFMVQARDKYLALKRIADINPTIYGIVFCRTRRETKDIADKLINDGYNADALHGDLSQSQRDLVMKKFRMKQIQLLVATDVAARGIDVNNLTHIINYGLPDQPEVYVHRSGRTGRANNKGVSVVIIHQREQSKLKSVEKKVGKKFVAKEVPTGKEVTETQLAHFLEKIATPLESYESVEPYLPLAMEKLEQLSKEDLIKNLVSFELEHLLSYYQDAKDLVKVEDRGERGNKRERGTREPEKDYTRFFINIGKRDEIKVPDLIRLVDSSLIERVEVGRIDLMKNFSFFEVKHIEPQILIAALGQLEFNNRPIKVEVAAKESGSKFSGNKESFRDRKRRDRGRGNGNRRRDRRR